MTMEHDFYKPIRESCNAPIVALLEWFDEQSKKHHKDICYITEYRHIAYLVARVAPDSATVETALQKLRESYETAESLIVHEDD